MGSPRRVDLVCADTASPMRLFRSTWPELLGLGWPVSATLLVRVTMRTVDLLAVGMAVGAPGVAALGIGDAAARVVLMAALGLGAGTIATVSQHLGADEPDRADAAVSQTAVLAVVVGMPLTALGVWGAPAFYRLMGAAPDVAALGVTYLRVVIATAVPRMLAVMLTRALQGAGDTRTPLFIRSAGTGINIALTVLLVFGLAGLPRIGVLGAALGTAAGNVLSAVLLVVILLRGRRIVRLTLAGLWDPRMAGRIVRIGTPQVVERQLYALGVIPLNAIVLAFGTAANAGFQVGRRMMLYGLLPARGIATAASTLMGLHVGAQAPQTGERFGRGALALATGISLAVALPLFVLAGPVAGMFVREPQALVLATTWMRVYVVAMVVRAAYGVLRGAMQGAGDTRSPLYASALGIGLFALGFSWLVGVRLGAGLPGVFAGVLLDPAVRTAVLYRWFDRGRWRWALEHLPAVGARSA